MLGYKEGFAPPEGPLTGSNLKFQVLGFHEDPTPETFAKLTPEQKNKVQFVVEKDGTPTRIGAKEYFTMNPEKTTEYLNQVKKAPETKLNLSKLKPVQTGSPAVEAVTKAKDTVTKADDITNILPDDKVPVTETPDVVKEAKVTDTPETKVTTKTEVPKDVDYNSVNKVKENVAQAEEAMTKTAQELRQAAEAETDAVAKAKLLSQADEADKAIMSASKL